MPDTRPWPSIADLVDQFGLNDKTVRRRIAAGDLRAVRMGRLIRIDPESIDEWLRRNELPTSSPPTSHAERALPLVQGEGYRLLRARDVELTRHRVLDGPSRPTAEPVPGIGATQ